MYVNTFGSKDQVSFDTEADYYEFLGYLAKNNRTTKLVWENNHEQGAWAAEGRIQFYVTPPATLRANLNHTLGVANIVSRVNCNTFVEHIVKYHHFISNDSQNTARIRGSIPTSHIMDFERGLAL